MDFVCPYTCSYRTNSGYCGRTGGWESCQYRQLCQLNTVVGYVPPLKKTNYDRIVSKSPGELAEWLAEVLFHCSNTICDQRCPMYECCCDQPSDNIEDWLRQEVEDERASRT